MLKLTEVTKTYRSKKGTDCKALKGVSLELGEKGMYFLLGKSGSGKSTLLNIIGGLDKADDGQVLYNGRSLSDFSAKQLDGYRNEVVGFVFQEFNLLDGFNVNDNLALVLKMQKHKYEQSEIDATLEKVGMKGYGKRMPSELSGGQKQRIAIARALLKRSEIILADEPTGNLDSETGGEIFELLKEISKEKLVIIVTHDRDNAEKYGDGVIEIKDGEIVRNTVAGITEQPKASERSFAIKHKIPFVYKLRMALHNFKKHWIRSIVTSLAVAFSLLVIGMAQVQLCLDTERNIAKTYTDNGSEYIRLCHYNTFTENEDIYGSHAIIINQAATKWLTDNGYEFICTDYDEIYDEDIDFLELKFYGERLPLEEGQYYWSDKAIRSYIEDDKATFADGAPTDIPYEQMVGKTFVWDKYTTFIPGIYKTYYELFDENWDGKSNLGKYLDYLKIRDSIGERPAYSTRSLKTPDSRNRAEIRVGDKSITYNKNNEMYIDEQRYDVDQYGESYGSYRVFGDRGMGIIDRRRLADDETVISLGVYNDLFDDKQFNEKLKEMEPFDLDKWETYEEYMESYSDVKPAHIGEKLDITYIQDDINETLLALHGKKIIGVEDTRPDNYSVHVAPDMVINNINENYFVYNYNHRLILKIDGYSRLYKALKTLRKEYNIGVDTLNVINFYGEERGLHSGEQSMVIIAITSAILCLILMIGMVSFGVISRKKEIGIFKALGCKSSDIKLIFLFEVLLIGIISAVLSIIVLNILVYYVNADMPSDYGTVIKSGVTFMMMDWLSYLIILGASFVMTWIVSYLPLIKISRMRPVDAIKNL